MNVISFSHMPIVRINAPEWYLRQDFLDWLNGHPGQHPATWHKPGTPADEYSDVFVTYDAGDGSDSPQGTTDPVIPADIWITECLIWISNLAEEVA